MKINLEDIKPGLPKRLAAFLNEKGINQRQFALKSGLSNGLINQFLRKGTNLGSDKILKILSTFPELNANWWFREHGSMIVTTTYNQKSPSKSAFAEQEPNWSDYEDRLTAVENEVQKLKASKFKN